MKIGILVPSIYMYKDRRMNRISAPMDLVMVLIDALIKNNVQVYFFTAPEVETKATVVSSDNPELLENNLKADYQQDLLPETYDAVSLYETKKYFELEVTTKAYEYALQGKIDLIHVYHAVGNLAHFYTELLNIPTVYTLHVLPPPADTLERWRYQRFRRQNFIGISSSQKKGFLEIVPKMNIFDIVHHGLSIEDFSFNGKTENYMVFLGRLIPEKGLDIAIKATIETNHELQIATHLNKVTESTEYYQKDILPYLSHKKIKMHGLLKGKEKINLLKNAKAFILPIRWEEPFGMVMIESMACGTPVIAFARGASPEIIRDGETGFLVNSSQNDIRGNWIVKKTGLEGICEAVQRLYSMSDGKYQSMRKSSRNHVEKYFTADKMTNHYIKIYENIIKQSYQKPQNIIKG